MSSVTGLRPRFKTIYVEHGIACHPRTGKILSRFPDAEIIPVSAYTDVFNRPHQNRRLQQNSQALILAEKKGTRLYPSAPVCQDFGHAFQVCSCVLNCIFDCDYCWLKGMFDSAYLVVFVNWEDFFQEAETLLSTSPLYLSLAYQCDLVPLEPWLGCIEAWASFAKDHPDLWIEIRTKAASTAVWNHLAAQENLIPAFTLSPDEVISAYEHGTPSLSQRLSAVGFCMERGYNVRLCLDPLLYVPDWQKAYGSMLDSIVSMIDLSRVRDISLGTFRISLSYLHRMRVQNPSSALLQYPYESVNGYARLPRQMRAAMEDWMVERLAPYLPKEKIFLENNEE